MFKLSREGEGKHLAYLTDRRLVTQTKAKVASFVGMIFRERLKKDKNKRPLIRSFFYNARRSRGDFLHLAYFFSSDSCRYNHVKVESAHMNVELILTMHFERRLNEIDI